MSAKRARTKKDPAAPKRPKSAYILYCQENRKELADGGMPASEIMKALGDGWKALSNEEKKPYNEMAQQDKQRYADEMGGYVPDDAAAYHSDGTAKVKGKKGGAGAKKKRKKDPNEPKRGLSAYIFFGQEKRAEVKASNPEAKSPEIMKIIGQMWREMNDEDKKPYNDMAAEDRKRYERDRKTFEKTKGGDDEEEEEEEEPEEEEEEESESE